MRLLVVATDRVVGFRVARVLRAAGHTVLTAACPAEAATAARSFHPDLVLVSVDTPPPRITASVPVLGPRSHRRTLLFGRCANQEVPEPGRIAHRLRSPFSDTELVAAVRALGDAAGIRRDPGVSDRAS